jgi:mRNA-degrading endonuclease RelE of RelBE toxin-antitoxin system
MRISRHLEVEKDLKRLKRFSAPLESLEAWERLFCLKGLKETSGIKQCPGFGQEKIYKARVVPLREKCGKSGGYRLIFAVLADDLCQVIFFSRHGIYKNENELMKIIKNRIK